ncbi:uncharacterized protein KQ657_002272 [Scheffersomyces spartinae]|uniref:Aldehyde dehydrogenase domain-containing protein n=1 Tax=Scheffersomyces spartinae TaxID=45513 RepID=A0A9P8AKG9_9ASCO|nr:uncharacterized protein KQ657_002272 [Scheffersomyces spartinae]KAG7195887.1 hypothetical protein KQ657_002272 [Scheffersomyces spartinae]
MSLPLEVDVTLPDGTKVQQPTGLFINNEFVKSKSGATLDSINPSTGEVNSAVYAAEEEDIDIAVAAARKSFKSWKKSTGVDRGNLLFKFADLLEKNKDLLAALEAWDSGKAKYTNAIFDVEEAIRVFRYYAGWADKIQGKLIQNDPKKLAYTIHEPIGVCGQIIPWNYPILMAVWKIAPAVAAGNTLVLKTSEITPLSLLHLGKLWVEAGFPAGVLNIVTGYGAVAGNALASHLDVDKIAFTGSTATGRLIQKAASSNLKAVTLECGGKSPLIVMPDADIEQAVKWAAIGIMTNQGQVCTSTSRIYAHEDIYDDFVKKFADHVLAEYKQGNVFGQDSVVGPQISKVHHDKIMSYIDIGKKEGAKVVIGGEKNEEGDLKNGYFIKPTIFSDCKPDMRIINEEIFGPVVAVSKFKTDEEVLEWANQTDYGLGASIFTKDIVRAHQFAADLEAGMVWINSSNDSDLHVPFGGVKMSGFGRELGEYGLTMYTQAKAVHVNMGTIL